MTTLTPLIRTATRQDLEAIGDLWVELMAFHAALDDRFSIPPQGRMHYIRHVAAALRDSSFHVLVAVEERRVTGYILGYIAQNPPIFPHPHYGFISDVCIHRDYRRHGTGARLVHAICEWFRARGLQSIQLNAAHNNPQSQAFWRKMGCSDYLDHLWMGL